MATDRTLDRRTLNRALLERQLLLRRQAMPAAEVVTHLIGLQAQAPTAPYFGLWSRLVDFDPAELSELLVDRRVVRAPLMRATIHLVTAPDCLPLHALLRPIFDRALLANAEHAPALAGIDRGALAAAGREALVARPLTSKALGERLAGGWPGLPPRALAYGVQYLLPVVQVPPRGVWGASGQPAWACAEAWLDTTGGDRATGRDGATGGDAGSAGTLVRRYLAAFGPASVADLQQWCGITGLGSVVENLPLRTFRDERGRRLYDVPDAPLPDPDTPAPVRLVAPFDNLLLSHADRTRIISEEHRRRVFTVNGLVNGTVTVDGFVAGMWRVDPGTRRDQPTTLTVELFDEPSPGDLAAVEAEATALLDFATPAGQARRLVWGPAVPARTGPPPTRRAGANPTGRR